MDFPDNETSTFFVGTEEGGVYQANRYDRAGAKAGLNHRDSYRGHTGPVTSLDFHPLHGAVDFSDLFLTTSVDWTVKLWRAKAGNKASGGVTMLNSGPSTIAPLYSFEESSDYVYDAKWHPKHPAVFGTVDGTGKFDLWNLNNDVEVSRAGLQIWEATRLIRWSRAQAPTSTVAVGPGKAINKLAWDRKDGKKVALGSSDGHLYVYDVGEAAVPRDTEWADMQKTVQTIMQTSALTSQPLQGRDGRS
jgi:dynein intermediate chain